MTRLQVRVATRRALAVSSVAHTVKASKGISRSPWPWSYPMCTTSTFCERNDLQQNGRPGGLEHYPQNQDVGAANRQFSAIESIGEKSGLANLGGSSASSENENPGASGNATGADNSDLAIVSAEYRLRLEHARTLAFAIGQCDPRDACWIMAAALDDLSAGMPGAPLFSFMQEANWWADWASEPELKAYLLACWTRLSPKAQAAFLSYIERGAAA